MIKDFINSYNVFWVIGETLVQSCLHQCQLEFAYANQLSTILSLIDRCWNVLCINDICLSLISMTIRWTTRTSYSWENRRRLPCSYNRYVRLCDIDNAMLSYNHKGILTKSCEHFVGSKYDTFSLSKELDDNEKYRKFW